jgi:hypothetical protein
MEAGPPWEDDMLLVMSWWCCCCCCSEAIDCCWPLLAGCRSFGLFDPEELLPPAPFDGLAVNT